MSLTTFTLRISKLKVNTLLLSTIELARKGVCFAHLCQRFVDHLMCFFFDECAHALTYTTNFKNLKNQIGFDEQLLLLVLNIALYWLLRFEFWLPFGCFRQHFLHRFFLRWRCSVFWTFRGRSWCLQRLAWGWRMRSVGTDAATHFGIVKQSGRRLLMCGAKEKEEGLFH